MNTEHLSDALRYRLFWWKHSQFFLRRGTFRVRQLKLGGRTVQLSVPAGEERVMDYEFQTIFYGDCYGLDKIGGNIGTVVDVGSNLGFFSLAARRRFPQARIHAYEPNPNVQPFLAHNTREFGIEIFPEAVGRGDGWIEMQMNKTSLLATAINSDTGKIKKTAFAAVVERIGGPVDLLKLDCEGAEWEIFECQEIWKNIRRLTMEYHLWANPKMDLPGMIKILRDLGFRITALEEANELKWGVLQAVKI
jgi:FkbM family methyltransferase